MSKNPRRKNGNGEELPIIETWLEGSQLGNLLGELLAWQQEHRARSSLTDVQKMDNLKAMLLQVLDAGKGKKVAVEYDSLTAVVEEGLRAHHLHLHICTKCGWIWTSKRMPERCANPKKRCAADRILTIGAVLEDPLLA